MERIIERKGREREREQRVETGECGVREIQPSLEIKQRRKSQK